MTLGHGKAHRSKEGQPLWSWAFVRVCLAQLMLNIFVQALISAFPLYLGSRAFTATQVGMVVGGYTICTLVMRLFSGALVDEMGRRAIGLMGIGIFALPLLGLLFWPRLPVVVLCRFLQGFGASAMSICVGAMATDVLPKSRLAEGIGYFGLCISLATAIGPAIGVTLAQDGGMAALFALCGVGMALCFILVWSLKYEGQQPHEEPRTACVKAEPRGLWYVFERQAAPICLVSLILSACMAVSFNYIAPFAVSLGIRRAGLYFTVQAVANFISRLFFGRLSRKMGYFPVFLAALGVMAVGFAAMALINSLFVLLLVAVIYGLGGGVAWPMLNVLCLSGVAANHRGRALSTYFASYDLGLGLGGFVWGMAIDKAGYRFIFVAAAVLTVAALALAAALKARRPMIYEVEGEAS